MSDLIKLGKYEIIKELGRGGFGIVYHARDLVLGRDVALKVLHSQHTVDVGFIGRFEQEARLSAQLEHPNLVPVYDFSELDGRYFIAMGLMSGGSLKDQLRQYGPIDTFRTKKVLNQVLEGMRYIHDKDVVHRDLKPSNILFDPHGTARISDLGFAKASKSDVSMSLSTSGGLVGTPAYMAPEVWRGKPATAQSDIYSLGCIVYEMLTGRILFDGETPAEAMTKHIIDGAQFEAVLASPWQALLARMLMKEPSERYSSAGAVLEDLKWGLFDAPQEREREIVLGGMEDEQASAEGIYAGEMDGAAREEEPYIELSNAEDLGEDVEPALEDARLEDFVEEEPKDPAQEDHPTAGKRQKVSRLALGVAVVLLAVVLFVLARFVANRKAFVPVVEAPVEPPSFEPTSTPVTKVRSKDGMEMVYVPEGEFTMGSTDSDAWANESPVREVWSDAYWIDKYEVSNGQYQKCVNAGKCTKPSSTESFSRSSYYGNAKYDDFPVIYVTWHQAKAYCEWAGGSLPTEAQWEKAARGTDARKYPWGDESPNSNLVNYGEIKGDTTAVGSYPRGASPYGAMDMAGNVWEWVKDRYKDSYDQSQIDNPDGLSDGGSRVIRGGSWRSNDGVIRSAYRGDFPSNSYLSIGFRCVSSP